MYGQETGYSQSFSELIVQGKSSSTLDLAESEVESILAANNNTTVADLPFSVINQATLLSTAKSTTSTLTVLLGAVAAISLLVGGIGVMNISDHRPIDKGYAQRQCRCSRPVAWRYRFDPGKQILQRRLRRSFHSGHGQRCNFHGICICRSRRCTLRIRRLRRSTSSVP